MDTARLSPLEPLARAYQRAVPEHPADDGLFGPRSIVWRVNRDRCFPLAGMRSLMVQALHPLAMAGVGVPTNDVPATVASLREYIESVDLRQATPAARDAIGIVLDAPDLDEEMRELWRELGQVAVGTLPEWAREMYGFDAAPAELMERE